jgi:hypothetical protein
VPEGRRQGQRSVCGVVEGAVRLEPAGLLEPAHRLKRARPEELTLDFAGRHRVAGPAETLVQRANALAKGAN